MTGPPSPPTTSRKTTLFCPECEHDSPVDGDWVVRECEERTYYDCPECSATITSRPGETGPTTSARRNLCRPSADD